jgi:glycerol-3-phosphate acyltransferase PlsY
MLIIEIIIATLIAYLVGSISSAIIVCRVMGLPDPRTEGSRNPGATNVLRIGGKKAAIITLVGDALKGYLPVILAKWVGLPELGLALVTFAAFIGHLYPVFFRFEGGKGVATMIGCLLALSFPVGLWFITSWLIVAIIGRYSSLASLIAALLAPLFVWNFTESSIYVWAISLMSVLLIFRHRRNIASLFAGNERKIGKKS